MFFIFLWKSMIQVYTVVLTNVGVQLKVKLIDIVIFPGNLPQLLPPLELLYYIHNNNIATVQ